MPRLARPLATGAALLLAAAAHAAPRGPAFEVCLLENNLPYSERGSGTGFDVDVARAVARAGGRELKPHWIANATRITELDESDLPLARLAREDCDAIFSVPGPAADSLGSRDDLVLSAPYYGAAFELVTCDAAVPVTLAALRGRPVAIQSQTVAHFAVSAVGAEPRTYFALDQAFLAVPDGAAEAALLWGPGAGYFLRRARLSGEVLRRPALKPCALAAGYAPPQALRWNLHVALRARDKRLLADVEKALAAMRESGALAAIKRDYGIPDRAPFDTVYTREAVDALRREAATPPP